MSLDQESKKLIKDLTKAVESQKKPSHFGGPTTNTLYTSPNKNVFSSSDETFKPVGPLIVENALLASGIKMIDERNLMQALERQGLYICKSSKIE